jgi:photosystem II stability/assembly factor-like uncharacterized protein
MNTSPAHSFLAQRLRPAGVFAVAWTLLALLAGCSHDNPIQPLPCTAQVSGRCWTNLGPAGEGITAVALSPFGLLVGTRDKGVLKYDASRARWVTLGPSPKYVTSITVLPTTTNRLLVTLTPRGSDTVSAVVYASDNGGRTWYPRDGGLSAQRGYHGYAFSLAYDPANPSRLFVGLLDAIVRSTDGGATWSAVQGDPQASGLAVSALAVSPHGSGRVWAGGEDNPQLAFVRRSDDGGSTWRSFRPSPIFDDIVLGIATDPVADDRLSVAMGAGVRVSEDGGATWRLVLSLRNPGFATAIALADPSTLVAVSHEEVPIQDDLLFVLGLYVSTDRGVTWDTVPVPASALGGRALAIGSDRVAYVGTRSGVWSVALP